MLDIKIRPAEDSDVGRIVELENKKWSDGSASGDLIAERIKTFPMGNLIGESPNGELLCYAVFEFLSIAKILNSNFSWSEITGDGTLSTHEEEGDVLYGVNMSASQEQHEVVVGKAMYQLGQSLTTLLNKKGFYLGSRVPSLRTWEQKNGPVSLQDYVHTVNSHHQPVDVELRYFASLGFEVEKPLPDYYPDHGSKNHGALMRWDNKHYNQTWFNQIPLAQTIIERSKS